MKTCEIEVKEMNYDTLTCDIVKKKMKIKWLSPSKYIAVTPMFDDPKRYMITFIPLGYSLNYGDCGFTYFWEAKARALALDTLCPWLFELKSIDDFRLLSNDFKEYAMDLAGREPIPEYFLPKNRKWEE